MIINAIGQIAAPVRQGRCTLRINGDFYMVKFDEKLQQSVETAAINGVSVVVVGTGHTFKYKGCGKHHFYIQAQTISLD